MAPIPIEQRQILKQMVDEQNAGRALGSSPEIHNMGVRNNPHFMRRAQSNARGFQPNVRSTNYSDEKVFTSSPNDVDSSLVRKFRIPHTQYFNTRPNFYRGC
jgi:hypothetical protein